MLSHKILQHLNQLQQKKYRREFGEFIIEGIKGVKEALCSEAIVSLVIMAGKQRDEPDFLELIKLAQTKQVEVAFCARQDVGQIKTTETFPGVLAIVGQPDYSLDEVVGDRAIICLDQIKDPGNLGTIIRTIDWFGGKSMVLSEDCVDLSNPKVVRASMGSIFRVKVFQSHHLIQTLNNLKNKYKYELVGLTMAGESINKVSIKSRAAYVLGSESHGLRPEVENLLDKRYTIQGQGQAESLNVAVAAGILLARIKN